MASDFEQLVEATQSAQAQRPKPPKKAKPIKPNDDAEVYYRKHLRSLVRAMKRSVDQHVMPVLKRVKPEYTADAWDDDIEDALQAAAINFTTQVAMDTYRRLARQVVERTAQQTTASLVKSVEQSVGVDLSPIFNAEPMQAFVNANIEQNVSLIKSIPDEYFKSIRTAVYEGTAGQASPTSIAEQIQQQTGVSERRAKLIAGDQVKKITSQVTERRQKQAGIEYYQSIDAGDERVSGNPAGKYPNARISCWGIARRDIGYGPGIYRMDTGASWAGETGLHPGRHHINCRCTASPRFSWDIKGGDNA